jgi:hypothetical protein
VWPSDGGHLGVAEGVGPWWGGVEGRGCHAPLKDMANHAAMLECASSSHRQSNPDRKKQGVCCYGGVTGGGEGGGRVLVLGGVKGKGGV